jgi:hypothetical protein
MKRLWWCVVLVAVVLAGVAHAKKERKPKKSDPAWELQSTTTIGDSAPTLIVICDKPNGNLVYLSKAHYGTRDLGRAIAVVHQPDDCLKDDVVGMYDIPKGPAALRVVCDTERGNLVYLSSIFWDEKDFGSTIEVVHQPETCFPTPASPPAPK